MTNNAISGQVFTLGVQQIRRIATDSNTLLCWTLNESAAPFANTGTGGTLNLTVNFGTPSTNLTGLFGQAVGFNGNSGLSSGNTSVDPTGTSMTLSCWVFIRNFAVAGNNLVNKEYRNDGTHNSPYNALGITQLTTADGTWQAGIAVSGSQVAITMNTSDYKIPQNTWTLLAITYDGTTLSAYINGALAGTAVQSGTIDFGTNGPYGVGDYPNATGASSNAIIDDVRVESTVRSQSYLQNMYKQGVGLTDILLSSSGNVYSVTSTITATTYTALITDQFIPVDSTSNVVAITLPLSPITGESHTVADISGTAVTNNITINGNGKNIVGSATYVISSAYNAITVVYNGTNWSII